MLHSSSKEMTPPPKSSEQAAPNSLQVWRAVLPGQSQPSLVTMYKGVLHQVHQQQGNWVLVPLPGLAIAQPQETTPPPHMEELTEAK
ncbi:hypothetical protein Ciccas_010546 [Cichlidogyrus casuarinus]|uniref:Uncharacterized protein n=1 Tax=Cichlidogyrus casuarinus TaxID=1844966 RepID=A0ABD2PTX7_9PLAT